MKILDRYIIKKVLSTFFFVMMILVAIIVVIDITEKVDKFNDHNLKFPEIFGYYMDFVPWISGLLTPIICFIAIVYVTSRLAAHTEIVAMLSSGISFRRLLLPYFIASSIIASISFVFNGWVIPHSNRERLAFEMQYFQNKFYFESRNVHMQTAPNVYLFIQNYNNQSNTGYQFSLEKFSDNKLIEKLTADNIQWDSVKHKWTLRYWRRKKVDEMFEVNSDADSLKKASTSAQVKSGDDLKLSENVSNELKPERKTFQRKKPPGDFSSILAGHGEAIDTTLAITPKDFENNAHEYDGMTIPELGHQIAQLRFRGTTGVEAYEVERHIRFAAPCTTFVLVFMGVIVSSRKSRGGTGFQIALGFLLAFVFILFFTMTRTFAETGSLAPFAAAWLPNALFGMLSLFMYKYVPR
ncbi:MAG: LptF/LptG family permease [Bacteroidetes bacterium]|nr:LptF/LptG family permease [Bacteroidota bacterium]MBI3481537.1 LptF/LptG family permease [Bacteroidota bacterium]